MHKIKGFQLFYSEINKIKWRKIHLAAEQFDWILQQQGGPQAENWGYTRSKRLKLESIQLEHSFWFMAHPLRQKELPGDKTWKENLRRTCTFFCSLKKNILGFIFSPLPASSTGFLFISRVLFSPTRESLHCYSFCPAVTCREQPWRKNILVLFFGFLVGGGAMLTCNQSPVNPARGRKKKNCVNKQIQWRWEKTEARVVLFYLFINLCSTHVYFVDKLRGAVCDSLHDI